MVTESQRRPNHVGEKSQRGLGARPQAMRCQPQHHGLCEHAQVTGLAQTKASGQGKESHRGRIKKTEVAHEPGVALRLLLTRNAQRIVERRRRRVLAVFIAPFVLTVVGKIERDLTRRKFSGQFGPQLLQRLARDHMYKPRLRVAVTRCALGTPEDRFDNVFRHRVGLEVPHRAPTLNNIYKKLPGAHAVIHSGVDLIDSLAPPARATDAS